MTSVAECAVAISNVEVEDELLISMFRSCVDACGLVKHCAGRKHSERALRLLIAEKVLELLVDAGMDVNTIDATDGSTVMMSPRSCAIIICFAR